MTTTPRYQPVDGTHQLEKEMASARTSTRRFFFPLRGGRSLCSVGMVRGEIPRPSGLSSVETHETPTEHFTTSTLLEIWVAHHPKAGAAW